MSDNIPLYDFTENKERYVQKSIPIIQCMIDKKLISALEESVNNDCIDPVLNLFQITNEQFNYHDIESLKQSLPLLTRLKTNGMKTLNTLSDEEYQMLPPIISKRYLLNKTNNENRKVLCNITTHIGSEKYRLLVNCYNSWNETYIFKPIKGSIDDSEDVVDAMIREINEELGIEVSESYFTDCTIEKRYNSRYYIFNIVVPMNLILCRDYNLLNLDLEITKIKLVKCDLVPNELDKLKKLNDQYEKELEQYKNAINSIEQIKTTLYKSLKLK